MVAFPNRRNSEQLTNLMNLEDMLYASSLATPRDLTNMSNQTPTPFIFPKNKPTEPKSKRTTRNAKADFAKRFNRQCVHKKHAVGESSLVIKWRWVKNPSSKTNIQKNFEAFCRSVTIPQKVRLSLTHSQYSLSEFVFFLLKKQIKESQIIHVLLVRPKNHRFAWQRETQREDFQTPSLSPSFSRKNIPKTSQNIPKTIPQTKPIPQKNPPNPEQKTLKIIDLPGKGETMCEDFHIFLPFFSHPKQHALVVGCRPLG